MEQYLSNLMAELNRAEPDFQQAVRVVVGWTVTLKWRR